MTKLIKIRGHHLLCIPRFYGGGYDKPFGDNMKKICFDIRKNPDVKIKVLKSCDDLCEKCPYKKDEICKKTPKLNEWVLRQDEKVMRKLKISEGSTHTAKDIFSCSIEKITAENLGEICKGCVFLKNCLKVGINNSFKKDLSTGT
jgi:uncharacterized protein